ncbi:MAG: nitronate monooxygenase [Candidatus Pacebacteria bacterium]|nr:nitronate monooxygenase [Candidatus Paceibacterota bacterium]
MRLWQRGAEFLGCRYAIMGGAMSWVSESHLVAAISNAGGFGVLACGSMSPELLANQITATQQKTTLAFGVNLILLHPQLDQLMQVCIRTGVKTVVLAGGVPSRETVAVLKAAGVKVIGFAPTAAIGKKLVRDGVGALIIEGSEAGGHIGPVSTSVLAQEILPEISQVPVFVAGGIGRGESIVSYLQMGASGVQLGTRFVCATESIAHANFKRAFINAKARDAVASVQLDPNFPVIPVRALLNHGSEEFLNEQSEVIALFKAGKITQYDGQQRIEHFWAGALRRAVIDGDVENGSLMAGQSVGMVSSEQSCDEILQELVTQAQSHLAVLRQANMELMT